MSSNPLVIGHRGAAVLFPENTMASFEAALHQISADMIEFDVQESKDKVPVVIHDDTLERTTNGLGRVSDHSLSELKKLDAGFRFNPSGYQTFPFRGKGLEIPTLEEVLRKFPDRGLAIEIKSRSKDLIRPILDLAARYGQTEKIVVGSLQDDVFLELEKIAPPFRLFTSKKKVIRLLAEYYIRRKRPKKEPSLVASMPVRSRYFDLKKKSWIDWLKSKNVAVYYWTVNDPALMEELVRRGADGLMSDDPGLLKKTLDRIAGIAPKGA